MKTATTAIILIGFQNDYFAISGILHKALEDSEQVALALSNTLALLEKLKNTETLFVATPIHFAPGCPELVDPIGILKIIKDNGAFIAGAEGAEAITEIKSFGDKVMTLPGKRGLNCFSNTDLQRVLHTKGIKDVLIAGAVTSLCIDTAGREAADLGYRVYILKDCTVGRTAFEREYYANEIMPLYAKVVSASDVESALEC